MKFPNFYMNKSFSARALILLAALILMASTSPAQKRVVSTTFAPQNVSLDIEQCANGPLATPIHCNTSGSNEGYGRGNLVASKSHYKEGDSVPIRITAGGVTIGNSGDITIGYDYTKGGKYATDYLTSFNRTESVQNDPCVNFPVLCAALDIHTFPIPVDPDVTKGFDQVLGTADDIVQDPGVFTCFGCTINSASLYTLTGSTTGDSTKSITLNITANEENIVIAYGSHISTRRDWGILNSAINISGSPYHNYIVTPLPNSNNGNRDLQLSADAVIFPAGLRIVKLVDNGDGTYSNNFQAFGFTSTNFNTAVNGAFTLTDTDPTQFGGAFVDKNDIVTFGATGTITVTENQPSGGYSLSALDCTIASGSGPGGVTGTVSPNPATRSASIVMQEGNIAVCTFTNTRFGTTAAPAAVSGQIVSSTGSGLKGVSVTLTDISTGEVRSALTNNFGYYNFGDLTTEHFYRLTVTSRRYTFSQTSRTFTLTEDLAGADFIANE